MKKYYELYSKIKSDIYNGVYKEGDKLPSKRNMTSQTGFSQITVITAYEMLEAEGFIAPRERSGYYVLRVDRLQSCRWASMLLYLPSKSTKA